MKKLFLTFLVTTFCSFQASATDNDIFPGPSITIPSKADIVGFEREEKFNETVQKSWQALKHFTQQTLHNFQEGNKYGIFYIHSLEDIMGAQNAFLHNWNSNHPDDQRTIKKDEKNFHQVFNHTEFVDNYIEYILAARPLISGSIIAFHEDPTHTVADTFSPVSFILDVPAECIAVTSLCDAQTPVIYLHEENKDSISKIKKHCQAYDLFGTLKTLDSLIRYPDFCLHEDFTHEKDDDKKRWHSEMNEIAILSCAKIENQYYRPKIVGVLFNPDFGSGKFDYGNAERNQHWKDAAELFSRKNNLPFITLGNIQPVLSKDIEEKVVNEWFDEPLNLLSTYKLFRFKKVHQDNPNNKYNSFLLSDEQLQQYRLKRIN